MSRTTLTTRAADIPRISAPIRIHALEGVTFNHPDQEGLSVEQVMLGGDDDVSYIDFAVWHDKGWMFGIQAQPDDEVTWSIEDSSITPEIAEIQAAPDRTGLVRVHGTWKQRGEVYWAPDGHPFKM